MKLQLRVLAALVLCVAVAAADKPHQMRKLVAKSIGTIRGRQYETTHYLDDGAVRGRRDISREGVLLEYKVLRDEKIYVFDMYDHHCRIEPDVHIKPTDSLEFGTLIHSLMRWDTGW